MQFDGNVNEEKERRRRFDIRERKKERKTPEKRRKKIKKENTPHKV